MKLIPKWLIIDKSVFQATSTPKFEKFAQNHSLILPQVLYSECLTDRNNKKEELVQRFICLLQSGAYICPASGIILREEAKHLMPYNLLVGMKNMEHIRERLKRKGIFSTDDEIKRIDKENHDTAEEISNFAQSMSRYCTTELVKKIRSLQISKEERFTCWIKLIEQNNIHDIAVETLGHLTSKPDRYCLSKDWVSWHYVRLMLFLYLEHFFIRETGNPKELTNTEHDYLDIEYVLLLSKADGLLTKDEKMVEPLAKAAFPEKDVFHKLDEVPDEYLCR
jgi:hypothetical protein